MNAAPMLRTSERRTKKNCEQQWDYAWNQGLEKRGSPPTPLWFGTGVHLALALWYCGPGTKRGPHPAETWVKYADNEIDTVKIPGLTDDAESVHVNAKELGISMMENYVKTYGKDEHMHVIQPEQTFSLDIPWPKDIGELSFLINRKLLTKYVGSYDLVWRNLINDQLLLEEHKTAATIRTAHLTLDDQGGSYWATAARSLQRQGLIGPRERLRGIEYNFMRKGLPDERPKDADGAYTNKPIKKHYHEALIGLDGWDAKSLRGKKIEELEQIAAAHHMKVLGDKSKMQGQPLLLRETIYRTKPEQRSQLLRIQNEAMQIELLRRGIVKPSKNPTMNCSLYCSFFDLCELEEKVADSSDFKKGVYKTRDVYADHRKSTDE